MISSTRLTTSDFLRHVSISSSYCLTVYSPLMYWNFPFPLILHPLLHDPQPYFTTDLATVLFKLLKPSGFFPYRQVQRSKILCGARLVFSVLYGYQNRQRLLLCASLSGWFLQPWWKVFTARYELIPFIYIADNVSSLKG